MKYSSCQLNNGLEVILAPLENSETVTVLFLVKAGSKYEEVPESGISHFLEHMFFKGTRERPSTFAIAESLDRLGGIYNAFTSKEYTGFYIKIAHPYLSLALDVLSDILTNSLLKEAEVNREKKVILEEIKLNKDTPTVYVEELFEKLLYGDTPAGRLIIGTNKTVAKLTSKDLKNYLNNHYSSRNSLLIIAGKIREKEVLGLTQSFFDSFPQKVIKGKPAVKEVQKSPGLLFFPKKTDQTHLCIGVRAFHLFDERKYALAILDEILGGGMSSRLFIKIRERKGLAYYIKSEQENYTDSGYLVIQAGIAHQNIKKVVKLILEELSSLKNKLVSSQELKKAKEHLKGTILLNLETSDQIAAFLGKQKLLTNEIKIPEALFRKLDQVSAKDVQKIAQNIFVSEKLNLTLISPLKNHSLAIEKTLTFK